jgi:hypothetical protein
VIRYCSTPSMVLRPRGVSWLRGDGAFRPSHALWCKTGCCAPRADAQPLSAGARSSLLHMIALTQSGLRTMCPQCSPAASNSAFASTPAVAIVPPWQLYPRRHACPRADPVAGSNAFAPAEFCKRQDASVVPVGRVTFLRSNQSCRPLAPLSARTTALSF